MALSWLRRQRVARSSAHGQPPKPVGRSEKRGRSPSPETTGRLLGAVGGELDRLRSDVAEELVLVRLLLNAGHVDAANRLMDEQSARLRHFQDHVEAAIASAVVERTAEEILAAAAEAPHSADFSPSSAAEGRHETAGAHARTPVEGNPRPRVRLLVAAVSLVVLVAMFVTAGPLPRLYELVSGKSNGSSHSQRDARTTGRDTNATADDDPSAASEEVLSPPAESVLGDPAEAPEILLLLGRLARFAEGTGNTPVSALFDVDRLVARLVTEVAPLLAPLPSEPPQGEAARAPHQPAQPNAAPQAPPNPEPQPPSTGEQPASQTQPGGPPPPDAPLVTQPAPPIDEGAEGDSMKERWRKRREQGEQEPAPDVPDQLAPRD